MHNTSVTKQHTEQFLHKYFISL